LRFCP